MTSIGSYQPKVTVPVATLSVLLAALCGLFGWNDGVMPLALSLFVLPTWAYQKSRFKASLVMFAYFLAVARDVPTGAEVFFGVELVEPFGVLLWLTIAALLTFPWALLWPRIEGGYWWRLPLILLLSIVPPLGLIGWGNPLTAAGAIFPAFGWIGLGLTMLLIVTLCHANSRVIAIFVTVALFVVGHVFTVPAQTTVIGHDTALSGVGLGEYDFHKAQLNNTHLIETAHSRFSSELDSSNVLVLPESVGGLWLAGTAMQWYASERLGTVLLGAAVPLADGDYSNAVIALGTDSSVVVYRQRFPVPVGMWHPWAGESAVPEWFGPGTFDFEGTRYGALLCYEQLLTWPVLQTFMERPQIVIAQSNLWWARGTSVPAVQRAIVSAWARLFNVPAVFSFNY